MESGERNRSRLAGYARNMVADVVPDFSERILIRVHDRRLFMQLCSSHAASGKQGNQLAGGGGGGGAGRRRS